MVPEWSLHQNKFHGVVLFKNKKRELENLPQKYYVEFYLTLHAIVIYFKISPRTVTGKELILASSIQSLMLYSGNA